jgi:hypothetical protein
LQFLAAIVFDDDLVYRVFDSTVMQVHADVVSDLELLVTWLLPAGRHARNVPLPRSKLQGSVTPRYAALSIRLLDCES